MKVILMVHIPRLGKVGEVVRVAPGYARNYLVPRAMARPATRETVRDFEERRAELEAAQDQIRAEAQAKAARIEGLAVTLLRQAGESGHLYGSVTSRDIAQAVHAASGLVVERSAAVLEKPVRERGVFRASVVLHPGVSATVLVNVAQTDEEAARQIEAFRVSAASSPAGDDAGVQGAEASH
jgi:large subunit ribosomal protein L9